MQQQQQVCLPNMQHFDVLVVGAGISGIDAAYHLSRDPTRSFAILEARHEIGGTWSLFRYPGIRSDSEMFTLGFPFKPWQKAHQIAQGDEIRQYIHETVREFELQRYIRLRHKVIDANWSEKQAQWTLNVVRGGNDDKGEDTTHLTFTANFVIFASGYYSYANGYHPKLQGADTFNGAIVHPQFWPKPSSGSGLTYNGKRVVVIGSGATAVTLVPALAVTGAAHVTMIQRSPSYFATIPMVDPVSRFVRRILPVTVAYHVLRIRKMLQSFYIALLVKYKPSFVRRALLRQVQKLLPEGYALDPDFTPAYRPWQQRLCGVPDGDFFDAIRKGHADVVTGQIDTILADGVRMQDGREVKADIIVQATGLQLELIGGAKVYIDGQQVDLSQRYLYKGQLFEGVPNMSIIFGYVDASWTLGADLCSRYIVRLLQYMKRRGYTSARPQCLDMTKRTSSPFSKLTSGYFQRAQHLLPRTSANAPWRARQNAFWDWLTSSFDSVTQEMHFD